MHTIELLAPARTADIGIEAIRHGADAVYIGGPGYGARAAAGNSLEDIARLCDYAHVFGAKVYVTLNTILYDEELPKVELLVTDLYNAGVDALITQDLALLDLDIPPIALHASTQMDNCTPERAQILDAAGYSQIVLARELSLEQIRAIHAVTDLPLEAFVHGALCVSYSGRCYASEFCFDRSANRGRCAQFCRLAFDLVDTDGHVLQHDRHLLSLRDMNRSENLEEMMDAGVRSFKIEGRLKDAGYVKNVTAYYRQAIDEVISRRPQDYCRASRGESVLAFTPVLSKSFNRGFTNYFLHGRTSDIWQFVTPKAMGEHIGVVDRVGKRSFFMKTDVVSDGEETLISNGDGLTFINEEDRLEGFRVNKVVGNEIFPLRMPNIHRGTMLFRNEDRLWENQMSHPTAERRLPVDILLKEVSGGYHLTMSVADDMKNRGLSMTSCCLDWPLELQVASKPQHDNICRNLSKLGDTPLLARRVSVETQGERFIPASVLGDMRRSLVSRFLEVLRKECLESRDQRRSEQKEAMALQLHYKHFGFTANVANRKAHDWLMRHGAEHVAPAFEVCKPAGETVVMTCRHCLRYAFGQCPKMTGHAPTWHEPVSLRLSDGRLFPLRFDCRNCEMQVMSSSSKP